MNDQVLARRQAQADGLADLGLTPSEASLFNVLHFGLTLRPSDLCRRAAFGDYSIGHPVSAETHCVTLDACLEKGWLQYVDQAALDHIKEEIGREQIVGPIYGMPNIGVIDFTHKGAAKWERISQRLWNGGHRSEFAFEDVVHTKSIHYYSSMAKAHLEREKWLSYDDVVSVSNPSPIGRWRANWWRDFPEGFRLDVEQRRQWVGRTASSGPWIFLPELNLKADPIHAKDVLDRHHVGLTQWLVMTALERINDERRVVRVTPLIHKKLGLEQVSEAQCHDGLKACLSHGWIRRVDESFIAEIAKLLQVDDSTMPVPFDCRTHSRHRVDFSIEGAKLHRMLSAEIFGTNWEEGLIVEETYYREEHRYCATQAGIDAVEQEYAASREAPESASTTQIGPWCVYWWDRFPSGYRLELTFGKP